MAHHAMGHTDPCTLRSAGTEAEQCEESFGSVMFGPFGSVIEFPWGSERPSGCVKWTFSEWHVSAGMQVLVYLVCELAVEAYML